MRWTHFLFLPIAALAVARPLHAPTLKQPLPALQDLRCDYALATRQYYYAYAYSRENRHVSLKFLNAAESERTRCAGDSAVLALRILKLRSALFP